MKPTFYARYLSLLICLIAANHTLGHGNENHFPNNQTEMIPTHEYGPVGHKPSSHQTNGATNQKGLSLSAGIAATYRTDDATAQPIWQIPGVLMGGDAEAPEQGFGLDDAFVSIAWTNHQAVAARFELSQHGDHEPELDQAYFSYAHQFNLPLNTQFFAGRMKAAFSAENTTHASSRTFSENNLLYDAFFGAHYIDDGARVEISPGNTGALTLGAEIWRGGSFPATSGSGGGAQDLYLHWRGQYGLVQWKTGLWGFIARAEGRGDDRFEDGHSHGTQVEDNNIDFDGTQRMAGVFASILWPWATGDIRLQGEYMASDAEGDIIDPTRLAALEGHYQGFYLQPEIRIEKHTLALRYARLILDNHITGAGGEGLASDAGLIDMDRDPSNWGVSYRYLFAQGIGFRLEWTNNRTTGEDSEYLGIGVFWTAVLY